MLVLNSNKNFLLTKMNPIKTGVNPLNFYLWVWKREVPNWTSKVIVEAVC